MALADGRLLDDVLMHEADLEIWREIDNGARPIDWAAWFGHPDGADYLSPTGLAVHMEMIDFFENFFGPKWLPTAVLPQKDSDRAHVVGLGRFSPVFSLVDTGRAGQWTEALRWWAALKVLQDLAVPGLVPVRRNTRNDVTLSKTLHTLAQTRVAALGAHCGARVTLEPGKVSGPGDVLLEVGESRVFIEVVTLTEDQVFVGEDDAYDRHCRHLSVLDSRFDVYWLGDVPGQLNSNDEQKWKRQTEEAAARCVETLSEVALELPGDGVLRVRPGKGPVGTTLTGPMFERDQGERFMAKLAKKAAQSQGAGKAWIWVEDHGLFFPYTEFSQLPLAQKVAELATLVAPLLDEYAHLAGIVYTNASRRMIPLPPPQSERQRDGVGLVRGIPLDRVRQTVILNPRIVQPGPTGLVERMLDYEPAWLGWALGKFGYRGGLASLLAPETARLWTPS